MGERVNLGAATRKVDKQGRLLLPPDWRERNLGGNREVLVVKREGYLKVIPKKRFDITQHFDAVDLGVDAIDNWDVFERIFYGESP